MPPLLPAALSVAGRKCLIVGGGPVAEKRVEHLLNFMADVYVVSPTLTPLLQDLQVNGVINWTCASYQRELLQFVFLVVAATNDPAVNELVTNDALALGILVCNTSASDRGNMLFPGVLQQGNLVISVTTSGASPALVRHILADLSEDYGPEYAILCQLLQQCREKAKAVIPNAERRRDCLNQLAGDPGLLELIRQGRVSEAKLEAEDCVLSFTD